MSNAGPDTPADSAFLWQLYRSEDAFTLRERLPRESPSELVEIQFLRAAAKAAFADYTGSSAMLRRLLRDDALPGNLAFSVRELLMLNERSQFRYRQALAAIAPLRQSSVSDARRALLNRAKLLGALADVPPQRVERDQRTTVLGASGGVRTITASINGRPLPLAFDTAANFSVLSQSAARAAGIGIRPLNYEIGSSTGQHVKADVAIGSLTLGSGLRVDNAVFLVLPDLSLRIPGRGLAGLIGLPIMAQLGPIRFDRSAVVLDSHLGRPTEGGTSLALAAGVPILRIGFQHTSILCRIDTGANRTVMYENFYRRFSNNLGIAHRHEKAEVEGAGGPAALLINRVSRVSFVVAGRKIRLTDVPILREPERDDAVACSIGQDALRELAPYTIDLKRMRLLPD
ncbi:MAG TPA: retropepsin-like aspartic protease [Rhizomicrobium sp.]